MSKYMIHMHLIFELQNRLNNYNVIFIYRNTSNSFHQGQVEVRSYSSSSEFRKERTSLLQGNTISLTSLKGYCIAAYDETWYLAFLLEVKHDSNEVSLSFLHPHGPAPSFVFPSPQDVLIIDVSDILMSVSPATKTGRTYTLSKAGYGKAENMFASRNKKM